MLGIGVIQFTRFIFYGVLQSFYRSESTQVIPVLLIFVIRKLYIRRI